MSKKQEIPKSRQTLEGTRYETGIFHSITISPPNDEQNHILMKGVHKSDPISMLSRKVTRWLQKCKGIEEYKLYMDVSFPEEMVFRQKGRVNMSRAPRIHYHGIIKFNDIHSFLLSVPNEYYEMVGMVNIDTISDFNGWMKYSRKYIKHAFPKNKIYKHYPYILKYDNKNIYITETTPPKGIEKWLLDDGEAIEFSEDEEGTREADGEEEG